MRLTPVQNQGYLVRSAGASNKPVTIGWQVEKLHIKYLQETALSQGMEISLSLEGEGLSDNHIKHFDGCNYFLFMPQMLKRE